MAFDSGDSVAAHNFGLQIDGVMIEYLQGVSGLSQKQDVIEFKQNSANGKPITRKLPGVAQAGECTVTRGMTQSKAFSDWINSSLKGDMGSARKNASIILMDFQNNPVRRYHLRNAWCSGVDISNPEAGGSSALTEQVSITFEELTIE
jgi:phage tail-like protein